jgi:hypothetical protein
MLFCILLCTALLLLVPAMHVRFVNGKFPFCNTISILFGKSDYFNSEFCYMTVTFPHITSKNTSEKVQTESKSEHWQLWSTLIPHKRGYVASPIACSGWKSHIPEGRKKWRTANFWNMNGLSCGLAKMLNLRSRNTGEKSLKMVKKLGAKNMRGQKLCK